MVEYEYAVRGLQGSREEQQDRYCIVNRDGLLLAAICDGMGGMEHGGAAAETAVQLLQKSFQTAPVTKVPQFFLRHIENINDTVYDAYGRKGTHSGSTLVACILQNENIFWCSIGDSRLYQLKNRTLCQLTIDHNYQRLLKKKHKERMISDEELQLEMKKGNALTSFIGMQHLNEVCMNIQPLPWADTSALILMSDGLYNALSEMEIADCNAETAEIMAQRIEKSIMKKALTTLDNTTFIVIKRRKL